jgi:hypothetical protein
VEHHDVGALRTGGGERRKRRSEQEAGQELSDHAVSEYTTIVAIPVGGSQAISLPPPSEMIGHVVKKVVYDRL